MKPPSYADAFEVLCLQAADEGRGEVLFADSLQRARKALRPFMVGDKFPSVYLEFPLAGNPFLDVTVLYDKLAPGTRIDSPAVSGTDSVIDWYARECSEEGQVSFGFELDTELPTLPPAAIHFQPREQTHLVRPFCEALGQSERADLYLDLASRMPEGWGLDFFGLFRGRPDSPMRVCGYLGGDAIDPCVNEPAQIARVFDEIGFSAYDDAMITQVHTLMAASPKSFDFQLDIYPDGSIGDTFALDIQFEIEQPEEVRKSFSDGLAARVMQLLQDWGAADERWKLGGDAAFARGINVELDDGTTCRYLFTVMPQWVKARWRNGKLQHSKLYLLGSAGFAESS